jgi:hypothetical protein
MGVPMSVKANDFERSRRQSAPPRLVAILLTAIALLSSIAWAAPSQAQAAGQVRLKIAKAGVLIGTGVGSGVLSYRGRNYPFRVYGVAFGVTVGASAGEFEGWASGIREVRDFAGTYSSVGAGGTLVGGVGGVRLRNSKGVTIELRGKTAGMEVAANVGKITILLK